MNLGFSPCGLFFEDFTHIQAFFRSLLSRAANTTLKS
jgi:hypothetical protein